ncbi:MAG: hypothetical protein GY775_05470 [Candidatus Scalindua sp.]|nr:hypothetical protein [Candidatus Scalindua sp.]
MVILNQIVGAGGFSIESNLRLIIIAAIFIGIVVVLLCIKFARNGERTNGRNVGKVKAGEDIAESAEGTEEESVVNSEIIEEKIKQSEAEVITKFAEVIKDVRAKIDTKFAADVEDIKAEFTTKIEQLISKIDEREKEVVNKIEDVIDTRVQEALNKMSDKIDVALHTQKSSTASVLEKLVDSLRTEEVQVGSLQEEKTSVSSGITEGAIESTTASDMQGVLDDELAGMPSAEESNTAVEDDIVPTEIKEEELELPSEGGADVKLEAEEPIAPPEEDEEKVSGGAIGDTADFDMQEFLDAEPVNVSSSDESDVVVEEDVVPEAITEDKLEATSENKTEEQLVEKEPIASSGENEKKGPEGAGGDTADFDIQEFLDELENLPSEKDSEAEK